MKLTLYIENDNEKKWMAIDVDWFYRISEQIIIHFSDGLTQTLEFSELKNENGAGVMFARLVEAYENNEALRIALNMENGRVVRWA